jgi:putative membrane protein
MKLILRWLINALVIYGLSQYFPGISVDNFYRALIIVIVFGLISAVIGSLLKLVTLPINILTLGIGCLVINGLMFWLTSAVVKGFDVAGFWPAFWGALIYSICTTFTGWLLKK